MKYVKVECKVRIEFFVLVVVIFLFFFVFDFLKALLYSLCFIFFSLLQRRLSKRKTIKLCFFFSSYLLRFCSFELFRWQKNVYVKPYFLPHSPAPFPRDPLISIKGSNSLTVSDNSRCLLLLKKKKNSRSFCSFLLRDSYSGKSLRQISSPNRIFRFITL